MSDAAGWILLHRSILDSYIQTMPARQYKVAVTLMLMANWKPGRTFSAGEPVEVERGEVMSSLQKIAERTQTESVRSVRTTIDNLRKAGFLTNRSTNRYRVISITKFDYYQDIERWTGKGRDKPATSQRQASDKPATTIEEGKKGRRKQTLLPGLTPNPTAPSEFDFDAVYKQYPRKAAKKAGMDKAKKTIKTDDDYARLKRAVATMAAGWLGQDKTYCPGWGPFMNQERWRDDDLPLPSKTGDHRPATGSRDPFRRDA